MKSSKNGAKMTGATGWRLVLASFAIGLAACGREGSAATARAPNAESDTQAIEAAMRRYVSATNRGDIDALVALYTEDAVLLPPERGPIEGRNAIAEFWRQGTDEDLAIATIRVDVHGDMGYLVGRYVLPATSTEPADSGKYLVCLRRQPDGGWKVVADIWNSSVSPEPDDSESPDLEFERSPRWRISSPYRTPVERVTFRFPNARPVARAREGVAF